MPALPPTMQSVLKTLLVADQPLGRSTIIERADISAASYDRNIDELAALGIVEPTGNGGHRKWRAWPIPWWSPIAETDAPRTVDGDESTLARPSRWDDILYEITLNLGLDPKYELFTQPIDIDEVFAALPRLSRWRGFFEAHYGRGAVSTITAADSDSSDDRQSTDGPVEISHSVEVGAHPAARADQQRSLEDSD